MEPTGLLSYIHPPEIFIVLVGLIFVWDLFRRTRHNAPFPPGPRGLPLIGNLLDMPSEKEWLSFAKWGEKYGDIVSVSVLGRRLVIINSAQMAINILDRKSSIYSDRPVVGMGGELIGWKESLALMPYGARFRNHRRLAHQLFGSNATMKRFLPMLEQETRRCLNRIVIAPGSLSEHIQKTAAAVILQISHGYMIQEKDDPFVELAERTVNQLSLATTSGGFLVNLIPILIHIPDWFPGAGFKRTAREWASALNEFVEKPHNYVKQEIAAGTARLSFTSSRLEGGVSAEEEFDIKWLAATLYAGGADTTVASIYAFFKAMLLYPEVQVKAQAKIDAVIGDERLPRFDDREHLPYVNALVLEVTRWHTVAPAGLPHCATEDDVQFGYFIPKGSLVIANIWKMLHDSTIYSEPFKFNPGRFIRTENKEPELDPYKMAFGFGRRICSGRVLADASIFISCAMVLAVFDISKYTENGVTFEPDTEHTTGAISHPTSFRCIIQARSKKALELIDEERLS
ncbi:cytochrome P450 [Guyanagaster necrorhizus]|uniref:Cytochrome P450 n=1 Tax=Guyanagaster necrorhizus TaxID=856835 RepID=A0A9P7W3B9_9AGAR|nr:cytochrome P450 [Guyanagaster necrorhizus MCA 3950]KAG7451809.1 cytochrome P450 [Guyanagaster necrorhizus MCA 3950]